MSTTAQPTWNSRLTPDMDRDEAEHEVGELADEVFELIGSPEGLTLTVEWDDCLNVVAATDEAGIFGSMDAAEFERLAWDLETKPRELRYAALSAEMASF